MGDAHPGNIKLLPGGQVALIDFGLSATPGNNQAALFNLVIEYGNLVAGRFNPGQLFVSYLRFFGRDLYRALKKLSSLTPHPIDLNHELGQMAEASLHKIISPSEVDQIIRSPKAIAILDRIANQDNRLGLKTRVEDSPADPGRFGLQFPASQPQPLPPSDGASLSTSHPPN